MSDLNKTQMDLLKMVGEMNISAQEKMLANMVIVVARMIDDFELDSGESVVLKMNSAEQFIKGFLKISK